MRRRCAKIDYHKNRTRLIGLVAFLTGNRLCPLARPVFVLHVCLTVAVRKNGICETIDSYLTFSEFLRANCDKNMAVFTACCSIFTSFMGAKSGFLHKSTKCLYRDFTRQNECDIITVIY